MRKGFKLLSAAMLGMALSIPAMATPSSATGLTAADVITPIIDENKFWIGAGLTIVVGMTFVAAVVKAVTRRGARIVRG